MNYCQVWAAIQAVKQVPGSDNEEKVLGVWLMCEGVRPGIVFEVLRNPQSHEERKKALYLLRQGIEAEKLLSGN